MMPRSRKNAEPLATLSEVLHLLTVDDLKERIVFLPTSERPTRKAELVSLVERHLDGKPLQALWEQLDTLQKNAVCETAYAADGVFNAERFVAKYGSAPNFGTRKHNWGYSIKPSLLQLFLYRNARYGSGPFVVPQELAQRIRQFVPPPAAPRLEGSESLPEFYDLEQRTYEFAEDDDGIMLIRGKTAYHIPSKEPTVTTTVEHIPVIRRDTERAAMQDVQTVLRLIDQGKVAVSDKTLLASRATMQAIAEVLRDGDFFAWDLKAKTAAQAVGPMKAFAWPLLVQAANLAALHGKKLALTNTGRKALSAPQAETLRVIWNRWLKTKLLDEFNRIDEIKGQHGRGKRAMTAVAGRRAVAAEALKQCPVGQWIAFDTFSRYMQAAGFEFDVTREPWDLYIADPNYGSLGHSGYATWNILQGRYLLCLLFEYAATLGLIDVAYVDPQLTSPDYDDLWGAEDLDFLSRYDGLRYFRLNPLGAFCLGLTKAYVPSQIEAQSRLTILSSLQISATGEALSADEALLLETYAEKEADGVWRLDRDKTLSALESGHEIAELRTFLTSRDDQLLPETVEGFLTSAERQSRALVNKGSALLIECADADIAAAVAQHKETKALCLRAGKRHLVVQTAVEERFRQALHVLGYGMPRV
jgi:hypothetical protein